MQRHLCALGLALLVGAPAFAQDGRPLSDAELVGDPVAGLALVQQECSACHAVEQGANPSPDADAPTFQSVANTPGMTSRAIAVWLTTFHPARTMPLIVLSEEERQNVIAYLLSISEEN